MKKVYQLAQAKQLLFVLAGLALSGLIFALTSFVSQQSAYASITFLILSILFVYAKAETKNKKTIANVFLGMVTFVIFKLLYDLLISYYKIPAWDFPGFYIFSKVGMSGASFYDPNAFSQIFSHLHLGNIVGGGFIDEIVNVGFWYPPPSMFLFLPLGLFDIQSAYIIWQSILIAFLVIDVLLLVKYYQFQNNGGVDKNISLLFLLSLILFFPGFISSINISQTIFIFLFLLILLIQNLENWKAGMFLALLIIIKPLAAIFALYFLIFKKWKIFISFILSGSVIVLLTIVFFGFDSFITFFKSPPTIRIPSQVFYESTNQSLNGVLLRLQLKFFGLVQFSTIKVIDYSISFLMLLSTIFCSLHLSKKDKKLAFMIFVPMALLIYPNTLTSYTIILLPVMLYLFNKNYFKNTAYNVFAILILYGICHFSFFLFNLTLWILFVGSSFKKTTKWLPKINSPLSLLQTN